MHDKGEPQVLAWTEELAASGASRTDCVLEVAEKLFAERGYDNVTVRDIAAAAGVTHPLIYYYWESKRGLLAAVLEKNQARMRRVAETRAEARELVLSLVRENLQESRLYLLTLARALLDGMEPSDWPGGFPAVEAGLKALLEARQDCGEEAEREMRAVLMACVALLNGWLLLEEPLLGIVGLDRADRDEARETMIRSMERMLDQVLPADRGA